jgi:NAD(P)-dependent dehydrogenase (short-subunit alcohol dehydrogenase family)
MSDLSLSGKLILVTGAARRIGRIFALTCAHAGADIIIHHGHSDDQARDLKQEINGLGRRAEIIRADLNNPQQVIQLMSGVSKFGKLYALVNSAAIFERISLAETTLTQWEHHLAINLTAPFLLSQAFAKQVPEGSSGHIINILDWRATRPGSDYFPYTISKAALATLTKSLAIALAPMISVNGLALGAILPPADQIANPEILKRVPAGRWGDSVEIGKALLFLLTEPTYVTGEILHVDGGRHLL